jgi:hypothetical protein
MKRFSAFFAATLLNLSGSLAQGQLPDSHERMNLLRMAKEFSLEHTERKHRTIIWAQDNLVPIRMESAEGRVIELQYLDERMLPVYYETRNQAAAFTTGASQLNPLGNLRLFTTGAGMTAGVWDGGRVSNTHPELIGRVILKDSGGQSNHATHVGGTIMSRGVNSFAQGMAPEALIHSYEWNNDLSEMAAEAADGLILSNHSYGIVLGWGWTGEEWKWYAHPDSTYDYRFGYYSNKSKALDEISFEAPHYLIVWAAGNDRNDSGDGSKPPDGPYNTIGPEGVAKNVLAVGAVRKLTEPYKNPWDVVMSNFSSWGPVNDGRIKPDIVGAGVSLFSTIAEDNNYDTYSGTSMASPNVTGSLLLLQQLYSEINDGNYMKSATLKGLAIHTAREAGGSAGPDYQFGWGLLDTEKAARMILSEGGNDFLVEELTLFDGESFDIPFYADGSGDVVATISWTDPPANPVSAALSKSTLMLVNDLDIRIYNEAGDVEFFPWRLNPLAPASGASKGDNFRDNVEKITIPDPAEGNYILKVTHKGNIENGKQDFSLLLQTKSIPVRKTFYWVGNEGEWSNPLNWSFSSDGEPANMIPTLEDHVVFDSKSFSGSSDQEVTVTLNMEAECYSFSWFPNKKVRFISNGNSLKVFSSFFVEEENQLSLPSMGIILSGNLSNNVLSIAGSGMSESTLIIDGSGTWKLKAPLYLKALNLMNGAFIADHSEMIIKEITSEPSFNGIFDIRSSKIDSLQKLDFKGNDIKFFSSNSELIFNDHPIDIEPLRLVANNISFWDLKNRGNHLIIHGNNEFKAFTASNLTEIKGSNSIESFIVSPGTELIFSENTAQEILKHFEVESNADSIVLLRSGGNDNAIIEVLERDKLCFDFLDIKKITVTGASVFNAGTNSVIDNESLGWLTQNCDDILFANFDYEFACTNSFTYLYDRSTGNIDSRFWEINKNGEIETSNEKDTFTIFSEEGTYPVVLTITDASDSDQVLKEVFIIENPLEPEDLIVNGERYTSRTLGSAYQWFLDGEPIPGAIFRTFDNSEGLQGNLQVLTTKGACNIMSNSIVTSSPLIPAGETGMLVYPNPAGSEIFLDLKLTPESRERIEVRISDLLGRLLIHKSYEPVDGIIRMSTESLTPGMYLIYVRVGDVIHAERLVIQ